MDVVQYLPCGNTTLVRLIKKMSLVVKESTIFGPSSVGEKEVGLWGTVIIRWGGVFF